MLNAIGIIPKIFVTDADSGIDIAIQLKYPSAFHIHCIWHIGQNLPLRFRFKFGELFEPFKRDFYKCRNSLDQEIFEDRWSALLININIFTADIQTTSCYKSVNSAFKQLLFNLNNTLMDIFLAIEERLEKKQNNENYVNKRNNFSCIQPATIVSKAFSKDWTFANDFIENQEIWQITFKRLLENCVQSSIKKLIKQANQIACKSCDESFIELLQTYIADKNHEAFELEQSRHPKGRPTENARFKGPLEISTKSNIVGSKI
ncbi:unnamed protein product [Rhizophagus irregularis]|nr:unnamed protein product [Rhizophagus irregularis]